MPNTNYTDPVARLLTLGDPRTRVGEYDWRGLSRWNNYLAQFGLKSEHIPELIRMATDDALHDELTENSEVWGPLHAWRALGQLGAVEAVRPLLNLFHRIDDNQDDWVSEDLPDALALIGPPAIPIVAEYLYNPENKLWARVAASTTLEKIGNTHTQARVECIAALRSALENYAHNDELLNGFLVSRLARLDAVETAPLVEQAYKADMVDESVTGGWEDFQVKVGLLEEPISDSEENWSTSSFIPIRSDNKPGKLLLKKDAKREKNKRKQAKVMRKKSRKKK